MEAVIFLISSLHFPLIFIFLTSLQRNEESVKMSSVDPARLL